MKIKIESLLAIAKSNGYTGSETDAEVIRKYIVDQDIQVSTKSGGTVDIKSVEIVRPAKAAAVIDDEPVETKSAPTIDIDAKVSAGVEAALKRLGIDTVTGKRPNLAEKIEVKSMHEVIYDQDAKAGRTAFKSYDVARGFELYLKSQASVGLRHRHSAVYAKQLGEWMTRKGYVESTTAGGGAAVMEQFIPDVIQLVKGYGVARKYCRVAPMNSDRTTRPKLSSGFLTITYPGESTTGTDTTLTWTQIQMNAKKGIILTQSSREFLDDASASGVMVADQIARDIARTIAYVEDNSVFNSDGSGPTNNYIPATQGLVNIWGGTALDDSRSVTGGSSAGAHTAANITTLMGTPARYPGFTYAFHCTPEMMSFILLRLAPTMAGGITYREFEGLGPNPLPTFLGYPILLNNVMSTTNATASGTIDMFFGAMDAAVDFGDRLGIEIDMSTEYGFNTDSIWWRGTVRHDFVAHSVGTTTTQGPLAALYQS